MVQVSNWLANRTSLFDSSGIREVFNLAKELKDPINFSIGQVDYPLPEPVKDSLIQSIERGQTNYTVTQGIAPLRERLKKQVLEIELGKHNSDLEIKVGHLMFYSFFVEF